MSAEEFFSRAQEAHCRFVRAVIYPGIPPVIAEDQRFQAIVADAKADVIRIPGTAQSDERLTKAATRGHHAPQPPAASPSLSGQTPKPFSLLRSAIRPAPMLAVKWLKGLLRSARSMSSARQFLAPSQSPIGDRTPNVAEAAGARNAGRGGVA